MLVLNDISWSVPDKPVLRHLNLTIPDRKCVVVTGPNGGGKTSLAKLIAGITQPDSGKILLDGRIINKMSVTERARNGIAYAFQQPVRFKGITVKKLLELSCGKKLDMNGMCDCLSAVGLCARNYIDRAVDGTLSGGELKRIELASAIAKGGEVFLLDEPEAGIDLWSFEDLVKVFEKLHDKTVIIVSHQQRILETADKIILFENDKPVSIGRKEDMFEKLTQRPSLCWRNVKEN